MISSKKFFGYNSDGSSIERKLKVYVQLTQHELNH